MIKIVGLGPGAPEALTVGTINVLEKSENIFFRTEKHPTVDYLRDKIKDFKTYDYFYEECSSFDDVYANIAKDIIEVYRDRGELVYAVPGHPLVAEKSVFNLIKLCEENDIEYKLVPAVSFVDAMMDSLNMRSLAKTSILTHTVGGFCAGISAHILFSIFG